MLTNYSEASQGHIINFVYNEQTLALSPYEAITIAIDINKKFKHLVESGKKYIDAINELKKDFTINLFSSENGFPKLFEISTNCKTTEKEFDLLKQLAFYRTEVNLGHLNEIEGEKIATEIAAKSKQL
jgi:hypothetical protein